MTARTATPVDHAEAALSHILRLRTLLAMGQDGRDAEVEDEAANVIAHVHLAVAGRAGACAPR
ncbi:hypothetical protein [Streptomonospora nanhaiensis]|uniref:hypothetical protein n=1 Tax=Streptomonospora nanhaiensis TaxID=1323731 RepID=UPI001C384DFC|nr:hypothetical protein [Streptomonospora nanhaiensis]MBV2366946.1 hypothetical protein [Streptomonospora nanhaiensis]